MATHQFRLKMQRAHISIIVPVKGLKWRFNRLVWVLEITNHGRG